MKVPRYNYAAQFDGCLGVLAERLRGMLEEGRYILSPEVESFEVEFARYLGCRYVRGVNSGTDALVLTLRSLGIGRGDEVITQANTFYATVAAIRLVGAVPVLVDADPETFLIAEDDVEPALSPATRALLPVHLYGKPTPMARLLVLAERHGIAVVEDAAQAHGAMIDGRRVGTFGAAACFSFHPSKNLAAAGDGGAVATDDAGLAEILCEQRSLGQRSQNDHRIVAFNSRLDAIQAEVLRAKLPRLDAWNRRRAELARLYRARLEGQELTFQRLDPGETHVFHLFQIAAPRRDDLLEHLRRSEIDAVVRYPLPIHLQPAFADCGWRSGQFPVAERLARSMLCLPLRPDMNEAEIDYVADRVHAFYRG